MKNRNQLCKILKITGIVFISLSNSLFAESRVEPLDQLKISFNEGNFLKVAEYSNKLIELDSTKIEFKNYYASAQYKLKNYKAVIDLYSDRQAEYINSSLQLKLRSLAQARVGNYVSAISSLRSLKSLETLNTDWKAFYHYLVFKINPESSFKELARIGQFSPSITNDIIKGKLFLIYQKYDNAIVSFEAALKKDFAHKEALELLGDSLFIKNDFKNSILTYATLIKLDPGNSKLKIKLAQVYVRQGELLNAVSTLEGVSDKESIDYKKKLSELTNEFLNNTVSRSIAEVKSELTTPQITDGKLKIEESLIPSDIDIYDESMTNLPKENVPDGKEVFPKKNIQFLNESNVELSLGPKLKKYSLSGNGFNANSDYSIGTSLGFNYKFEPEGRNWNSQIAIEYSNVKLKKLQGLLPSSATFSDTQLVYGINYLLSPISLGPLFMYENMYTTLTTPSQIRSRVNLLNIGLKATYVSQLTQMFKLSLDLVHLTTVLADSKISSLGKVNKQSRVGISTKFYFEMQPLAYYFIGLNYFNKTTSFSSSNSTNEKEQDITFPLGINYAF